MVTAYFKMLPKDVQKGWKKRFGFLTGAMFNQLVDRFAERISGKRSDVKADDWANLRYNVDNIFCDLTDTLNTVIARKRHWKCDFKFNAEYVNDVFAMIEMVNALKAKAEHREDILACAEGKLKWEQACEKYPMLCRSSDLYQRGKKRKVQVWRDMVKRADGTIEKIGNYVWGHWEMIENKKYYSVDEIESVIKKILTNSRTFYENRLNSIKLSEEFISDNGGETFEI